MSTSNPTVHLQGAARSKVRRIIKREEVQFPCWLYEPRGAFPWIRYTEPAHDFGLKTHWHPDQETPPTEIPDDVSAEGTAGRKPAGHETELAPKNPFRAPLRMVVRDRDGSVYFEAGMPGDGYHIAFDVNCGATEGAFLVWACNHAAKYAPRQDDLPAARA